MLYKEIPRKAALGVGSGGGSAGGDVTAFG